MRTLWQRNSAFVTVTTSFSVTCTYIFKSINYQVYCFQTVSAIVFMLAVNFKKYSFINNFCDVKCDIFDEW